jgi:hypothetical protein
MRFTWLRPVRELGPRLAIYLLVCMATLLGSPHDASAGIVVGGWTAARSGDANLLDGPLSFGLREILQFQFPQVTIAGTDTLTDEFLAGVDLLLLTSAFEVDDAIAPLTAAEQAAMLNYVLAGGALAIATEGEYDFGMPAANASLLEPFGMRATGLVNPTPITEADWAIFSDPLAHPISNGPYGVVTHFSTGFAGWFDDLGPYATSQATLAVNGQPAAAVIERGALGPGSGPVWLISDGSPFVLPIISLHVPLVRNALVFLVPEPSCLALVTAGLVCLLLGPMARRSKRKTGSAVQQTAAGAQQS